MVLAVIKLDLMVYSGGERNSVPVALGEAKILVPCLFGDSIGLICYIATITPK